MLYCVLMPHFCTYTEYLFAHDQSRMQKMHSGERIMRISLSALMDTALASSEDNPFAAPKIQPAGKISVQLPTDDWLCRKMDRLNLTLTQGYPAKGSEPGGLQRDQFIKPTKSQGKWYGLHPNQDKPAGSVSFWHSDNAKVNSTFSRIARYSALSAPAPVSRFIAQDTLCKWERSACEATYV